MNKRKIWIFPLPILIAIAIILLTGGGYLIYALTKSTQGAGPVGYWKFDEGSGYTAYDASGNNNNGTSTNFNFDTNSGWVSGKVAGALKFDGSNDYMDAGHGSSLDVTTAITMEMWLKPNGASENGYIIAKGDNTSSRKYNIAWGGSADQVRVYELTTERSSSAVFTDDNAWVHVVVVIDGLNITFYRNGVSAGTATLSSSLVSNNENLFLGNRGGGTDADHYFKGLIDEVKIYNRALSPSEIAWEYNRGGPVGWWKMDEGSGSTVYDSSGNGNNGTVSGATSTVGKINSALGFDGTNDYVSMGNISTLNITNAVTVEHWIKTPVSLSHYGETVVNIPTNNTLYGGYRIYLNTDWKFSFQFSTDGLTWNATVTSNVKSANTWYHIVAVYDKDGGSGNAKMYIDGVSENPQTITGAINYTQAPFLFVLGERSDLWDGSAFSGLIDDVRVYNYARTAAEVRTDYNSGFAVKVGDGDYNLNLGLVGHWKMDEGSGYIARDSSNSVNTGTLKSFDFNQSSGWATGKVAGALKFDGTNDYVNAGSNTSLDLTSSGTVDAWIKMTDGAGTYRGIIGKGTSTTDANNNYELWVNNSNVAIMYIGNGVTSQSVNSVSNISLGSWYHIVGTWDGTLMRIYINGTQEATTSQSITPVAVAQEMDIGRVATYYANGLIDDVRVYNRALSADEVRYLYNHRGPVGWWKFDEGSGTVAYDSSINGNNGTISGATSTAGKINSALGFDGVDDGVTITDTGILNITQAITLEAWVYYTGSATYPRVVRRGGEEYALWKENTQWRFQIEQPASAYAQGTSGIVNNTWYHLVGTFDGTNIKIYINGKLEATTNSPGSISATSGGSINIGYSPYLAGLIDDVRIYNYARTAAEIRMDYNVGFAMKLGSSNESAGESINLNRGLLGYWNLEEGSGYTAKDSSGNSNNGTLKSFDFNTNSGWTIGNQAANTGGAIKFDGVDDYINLGNSATFDLTSEITVEAWVKTNSITVAQYIFNKVEDITGALNPYSLHLTASGVPRFRIGNGVTSESVDGAALTTGVWYHLVGVARTGQLEFYLNGVASTPTTRTINPTTNTAIAKIGIAIIASNSVPFNGLIDEVRVYNRALSADEIRYLYNRRQPIAYWKFDEGSGQKAYDSSINGNHGTLGASIASGSDDPTWATGTVNRALSFDDGDYAQVVDSSAFDLGTNITMETWLKANSWGSIDRIIDRGTFGIEVSGENIYGFINDGARASATKPSAGAWHHFAFTYSVDTDIAYTYIDGVLAAQESYASSSFDTSGTLYIGARQGSGDRYFNGFLDDVRIYNYARTAAEVRADYNAGMGTYFK